jgi:hypothetical protein
MIDDREVVAEGHFSCHTDRHSSDVPRNAVLSTARSTATMHGPASAAMKLDPPRQQQVTRVAEARAWAAYRREPR